MLTHRQFPSYPLLEQHVIYTYQLVIDTLYGACQTELQGYHRLFLNALKPNEMQSRKQFTRLGLYFPMIFR